MQFLLSINEINTHTISLVRAHCLRPRVCVCVNERIISMVWSFVFLREKKINNSRQFTIVHQIITCYHFTFWFSQSEILIFGVVWREMRIKTSQHIHYIIYFYFQHIPFDQVFDCIYRVLEERCCLPFDFVCLNANRLFSPVKLIQYEWQI